MNPHGLPPSILKGRGMDASNNRAEAVNATLNLIARVLMGVFQREANAMIMFFSACAILIGEAAR